MSARFILFTGLTARPDLVVFRIEVAGAETLELRVPYASVASDVLGLGF
jgi:hypothetical protein